MLIRPTFLRDSLSSYSRLRWRSVRCLLAAAAILFAFFPASAVEKSPWLEIHSTHFTVVTDAGDKKGHEVALRFEQMRAVFAMLLGKDKLYQPLPVTIVAFKNDKLYYQLAPLKNGQPTDVPGFFLPGEDQNFFVLNVFEEESWRAVAHDFAHMVLNANYPPAQGWFDEGLAEYFSSIRLDNKEVELGADPELQASVTQNVILQTQQDTHPPRSLTELLGAQVWLSMADLFTMKRETASYNEGTHHTLFYAQSWMTIDYLLHEKKLPETGAYFNLVLNQRIPVEEAIQKAYGMTAAQLEQAVKDYFHAQTGLFTALDSARQQNPNPQLAPNPAQASHFAVPVGPDDAAITAKPMLESDERALYAELEIRIPERREYGMKELQELATTPSATTTVAPKPVDDDSEKKIAVAAVGNEIAHRALMWDHMERGEFEEASAELGEAAALNPRDTWLRYYVSVLKYRMAEARHTEIQGLANMMQDLRTVLEWYPEFADAYDLMAVARMEGGGSTAAMQSERTALQLGPREPRYLYHMAQIYIANKQWEAAQALLDRLKAGGNPQIAALAREKTDQIATERKYGIPVASGASAPKLAPQKSPFDVLEQDAAVRAAAGEGPTASDDSVAPAPEPAAPETATTATPDQRPTKFLKGELVSVDCTTAPAAVLTVNSGGTVLKLRARDFKTLVLVGSDEFSCDWHDRKVAVNYKPGGVADGDLVSLEVR